MYATKIIRVNVGGRSNDNEFLLGKQPDNLVGMFF